MEKKIRLSIALAVYNEEKNLPSCLQSVRDIASEIVIVDGGSSDNTLAIAVKAGARVKVTDNPPMFHINKQKALNLCRGEWILQLDADETVSEALKKEIREVISQDSPVNGYFLPRKNYFWGKWMKKGGQYPDYLIRLVRNGRARFPSQSLHEQIEVTGETGYLVNPLLHHSYRNFRDYWRKAWHYIRLSRDDLKKRRVKKNLFVFTDYAVVRPLKTFFTLYFRHRGFLDGWRGFVFAIFSSMHHAFSYWLYLTGGK
jgi:glycosyltransferase involved in cell wall biosynthesis